MESVSIFYTVPWLLLALLYIRIYNKECKGIYSRQQSMKYCLIIFILFFGFRGFVGWDYQEYYLYFKECPTFSTATNFWTDVKTVEFEPGYSIYMILCKTICNNYHVFVLISTIIDSVGLYYIIKKYSDNVALSFLLFMTFALPLEIDLMRNIKGMFFVYLAIPYISQRNYIKYFALTALSTTFHFTTIIFMPLYFVLNRTLPRYLLGGFFVAGYIYYFLPNKGISDLVVLYMMSAGGDIEVKMNWYGEMIGEGWSLSWGFFERLITTLLLFAYYEKIKLFDSKYIVFLNLTALYLLVFLLFSDFHIFINRFSSIFGISYIIFFPCLLSYLSKDTGYAKKYNYLKYGLIIYCLVRACMHITIMDYYSNILLGAPSYEESIKNTSSFRNSF